MIFCNKRKRIWIKSIEQQIISIENPNSYMIFPYENKIRILPGIEIMGSFHFSIHCFNLVDAVRHFLESENDALSHYNKQNRQPSDMQIAKPTAAAINNEKQRHTQSTYLNMYFRKRR